MIMELNLKIKKFMGHKNIKTNSCRMQASDSIIRGYFLLDLLSLCEKVKGC